MIPVSVLYESEIEGLSYQQGSNPAGRILNIDSIANLNFFGIALFSCCYWIKSQILKPKIILFQFF
jgi:hypothetical protein